MAARRGRSKGAGLAWIIREARWPRSYPLGRKTLAAKFRRVPLRVTCSRPALSTSPELVEWAHVEALRVIDSRVSEKRVN